MQQERSPFPALPDGWSVIGRCRFGTGGPGPNATGCYALAHPKVGVALIDIVPNATPNAEARLRRALTAVEFWPDFPGTLPVVHDRLDAAALRSLPWVLDRWFAALPALTVPGGSAWIEGVRRAMAVDPAWELPGQSKAVQDASPAPAAPDAEAAAAPRSKRAARSSPARPRRWGRLAVLPLAFAGVFGLGLVSGFLLLESPAPVNQAAPAAAAPPAQATAAAQGPTAAPGGAAAPRPAETAAAAPAPQSPGVIAALEAAKVRTEATALPAAAPAEPSPGPAPAAAPAATAAAPAQAAPGPEPAAPLAGEAAPPSSAEGPIVRVAAGPAMTAALAAVAAAPPAETPVANASQIGGALPLAPPRAPAPPVRVSSSQPPSRPAPVIDRACSQALFRFQQGERLTTAEQNFLRTGCSTARR